MDSLKHVGITDLVRERLNVSMNTGASWSAQVLRMRLEIPSGPAAFVGVRSLEDPLHVVLCQGEGVLLSVLQVEYRYGELGVFDLRFSVLYFIFSSYFVIFFIRAHCENVV